MIKKKSRWYRATHALREERDIAGPPDLVVVRNIGLFQVTAEFFDDKSYLVSVVHEGLLVVTFTARNFRQKPAVLKVKLAVSWTVLLPLVQNCPVSIYTTYSCWEPLAYLVWQWQKDFEEKKSENLDEGW